MKKLLVITLLALAVSAWAGERIFSVVGTVKSIQDNEVIVIQENGLEAKVILTDQTQYRRGPTIAKKDAITEGANIAVETERDGETAIYVKITRKK